MVSRSKEVIKGQKSRKIGLKWSNFNLFRETQEIFINLSPRAKREAEDIFVNHQFRAKREGKGDLGQPIALSEARGLEILINQSPRAKREG